jgi:N-glycosylase/DNA lyase
MGELKVANFNLRLTLESGQFFRYERQENAFLLLTAGRAIIISQEGNVLRFSGTNAAFIITLFQLVPDYQRQIARLQQDPTIAPLLSKYAGLHVMRQDLHETIIGFICSSQSNIPKIRMNLQLLSTNCGEEIDGHFHLPKAGTSLDHATVLGAKTGYRAKFIVGTNKLLSEDFFKKVKTADYVESHALLCELPGVGPKIADCICLFALGHGEAFPVDVHILRAMRALFPKAKLTSEQRMKAFAQKRWGKDAGLAQQFIYQWARDQRKVLL